VYERPPEPPETVSMDDCWDWPRLRHPAAIIAAETMRTAATLFKRNMEESEPLGNKEFLYITKFFVAMENGRMRLK
jgi:hypothetical protein